MYILGHYSLASGVPGRGEWRGKHRLAKAWEAAEHAEWVAHRWPTKERVQPCTDAIIESGVDPLAMRVAGTAARLSRTKRTGAAKELPEDLERVREAAELCYTT